MMARLIYRGIGSVLAKEIKILPSNRRWSVWSLRNRKRRSRKIGEVHFR
jgi:hypothetical protein